MQQQQRQQVAAAAAADCIRQQQAAREKQRQAADSSNTQAACGTREAASSSSSTTALRLQANGSMRHAGVAPGCKQQHQQTAANNGRLQQHQHAAAEVTPDCKQPQQHQQAASRGSSMTRVKAAPGCSSSSSSTDCSRQASYEQQRACKKQRQVQVAATVTYCNSDSTLQHAEERPDCNDSCNNRL